ncbi:PaaI family thioesterase [Halorientalis salina]|uniref:PaaI family thioesterase n=1 Tax=Halorientalis salina TaxID=2932266 RepID=UPI0010AD3272|nr:PaaI family thioesterase [Halorientalis salina]
MNEDHYRKLESMYHATNVNEHVPADLSVREGGATLELPISEDYYHALGGVHGSYYFKALDDAAFFAANSLVEDVFVLTTDFNLYLERPVSEGTIRAEGEVLNDNPSQLVAGAVAYDDEGNELARGTGTFRKSDVELTADIGYKL